MIVRQHALVTVSGAVNGSPRRRGPDRRKRQRVSVIRVRPDVMAVARSVMRPGERIVLIGPECVELRPA